MSFISRLLRLPSDRDEQLEALGPHAKEMIQGVVDLSSSTCKDIMVPRPDVTFVSLDATTEDLVDMIMETGHSRLPVYHKTVDDVVGVLYAKDVLMQVVRNGRTADVGKAMRRPYFVPESKRVDELLHEFQRRRVHLAIVVDEYGGTSGIACLEDVLEEIVGDIQDEFDNESEDIVQLGTGIYLCDARVRLDELAEHGLRLPAEEFDTLGGFVFDLFGKIPVKYEKESFGNADFVIQGMDGHRITTVKVAIRRDEQQQTDA